MSQSLLTGNTTEVILPARGHTPWLTASLASIAAQTLPASAVTLVDDGLVNPAAIQTLGEKFFGARFRLLKNVGHGISAALNTGIQQSSSYWIMRMDADDVCHPDRLRQQLDFLVNAEDKILGCGTQVRFISDTGVVLGKSNVPLSWEKILDRLLSQTCFIHPTLVLRRDALLATPYRSVMDGAEDADLLLRLSEKGKILNLNQPLLDYRIHPTQESFRWRPRHAAVQELAFRAALSRRRHRSDPLDNAPALAEQFVRWRLATPGYARSRKFLTALRYLRAHFGGMDMNGIARCALVGLRALPLTPSAATIAWRVYRKAGAAMLDQKTPFESLNTD